MDVLASPSLRRWSPSTTSRSGLALKGLLPLLGLVCALGTLLILVSSWSYVLPEGGHPFLDERPALAAWAPWRLSLAIHVGAGLFCLPVGLFLMVPPAGRALGRLHSWLGRAYVLTFVLVIFPTGVFLSFFPKGGWLTGVGFFGSAAFGTYALVRSVAAVSRSDVVGHVDWAWRSYAQLSSAVTFRIAHIVMQVAGVDYGLNYFLSLYLSVLGNAAIAELVILLMRRRRQGPVRPRSFFTPTPGAAR